MGNEGGEAEESSEEEIEEEHIGAEDVSRLICLLAKQLEMGLMDDIIELYSKEEFRVCVTVG